jgi:hypothetical protein
LTPLPDNRGQKIHCHDNAPLGIRVSPRDRRLLLTAEFRAVASHLRSSGQCNGFIELAIHA